MKKIVCFIWLSCFLPAVVMAQTEEPPGMRLGLSISADVQVVDFDELNQRFAQYNYGEFENAQVAYNMAFNIGNPQMFFTSIDIGGFSQAIESPAAVSTSMSGFIIGTHLYYNMIHRVSKHYLLPYGGFSMSGLTLVMSDNSSVSETFDTAIEELAGERTMYTASLFTIDLGLRYDYEIFRLRNPVLLGVHFGYRYQLNETLWGVDGFEATNGPDINLGGWYGGINLSLF